MTWVVSGTLLSIILNFRLVYSRSRSRGQEKFKEKILSIGGVIHVFGSVFRPERKMPLEHFLNVYIQTTHIRNFKAISLYLAVQW